MNRIKQLLIEMITGKSAQTQLIEFVSDEKNIGKAVEGSMRKRIELLDRIAGKRA